MRDFVFLSKKSFVFLDINMFLFDTTTVRWPKHTAFVLFIKKLRFRQFKGYFYRVSDTYDL